MAEDACEDLEYMLDIVRMASESDVYHDHCDGKQYPPTREVSVLPYSLRQSITYNRAGSLWIVWTTG